jgi:hypothetical protein
MHPPEVELVYEVVRRRFKRVIEAETGCSKAFHPLTLPDLVDLSAVYQKLVPRPVWPGKKVTIDHIIPTIYFDLTMKEQVAICFSAANMHWMEEDANCTKSCQWPADLPGNLQQHVPILVRNTHRIEFMQRRGRHNLPLFQQGVQDLYAYFLEQTAYLETA